MKFWLFNAVLFITVYVGIIATDIDFSYYHKTDVKDYLIY
jgi:hypothetical protein